MKRHLILKDFDGSNTGLDFTRFVAGTSAELSDPLAAVAAKEGWAKPVDDAAGDIAGAPPELAQPVMEAISGVTAEVVGLDEPVPEGNLEEDLAHPAELRETKVSEPEETKPAAPAKKKGKA